MAAVPLVTVFSNCGCLHETSLSTYCMLSNRSSLGLLEPLEKNDRFCDEFDLLTTQSG